MITDPALVQVLPNGTLLNLIMVANLSPFLPAAVPRIDWEIVSQRSTDGGKTWTDPVTIATLYPAAPVDPQTGKVVRAYPLISAAVAPDGTAYVAWNVIPKASGPSTIDIARSANGGVSWSAPMLVKQSPAQAFLPSLAVAADGTVGVTYDDTRNDASTGTTDDFTTDVWFSDSHDKGVTWTERHLAGPFNMATAPESDSAGVQGLFVGDYQGLTALSGGFGAVYAQGQPQAIHGPTDLFFSRFGGS
jgi:Neuraminidase (sialidase)